MAILPLPQFEADLAEHLREKADREAYERLRPPTTVVARFGSMKMIGEFAYTGSAKPGCGSKLVVRTFRGTEVGEMLTSTCPNSGCSKSVSRQDMLRYIENSGGRDYPFSSNGRVLRIATAEDLHRQQAIEDAKAKETMAAREEAGRLGLPVKVVEVEEILGGERVVGYYASEERVELHELGDWLSKRFRTRADLRPVGARDEARLVADYERCGQYCCCKNFLKVLKPISMRSAKTQKATLDPLKISGRCGRLMCCLRYEDETYEDLRKRLPKRKTRVGTPDGDGIVMDTQILTQLALVLLDGQDRPVAIPIEELTSPTSAAPPPRPEQGSPEAARGARPPRPRLERPRIDSSHPSAGRSERSERPDTPAPPAKGPQPADVGDIPPGDHGDDDQAPPGGAEHGSSAQPGQSQPGQSRSSRRRRRRRAGLPPVQPPPVQQSGPGQTPPGPAQAPPPPAAQQHEGAGPSGDEEIRPIGRRRRRRRRSGGGQGGDSQSPPAS